MNMKLVQNLTCDRCGVFFTWRGTIEEDLHTLEYLCKDCQYEKDNEE